MRLERIQIELTTKCNLRCEYCLKPQKDLEIERDLIENLNGLAKKYVLYGYGEPFLHQKIAEFVRILDGEIVVSTNGMVDEKFAEVADFVDVVGISLDLDSKYRRGMEVAKVLNKVEKLKGRAILAVVLTYENVKNFPLLAESLAKRGAEIIATNMIAPNPELYSRSLYFEGSRRHADFLHIDEDFVLAMLKARKKESDLGINAHLNFCALLEAKERIEIARKCEDLMAEAVDMARNYGVHIIKPEFFGESDKRDCPYRDSIFIRSDGFVSPCMPFAYTHEEFVNRRYNRVREFVLGHLNEGIDEVVKRKDQFEELRKNMDFPWCGDCGHSAGCWYLENGMDCYGNIPSCSQCLYSTGIAKCLI